MREVMKGAYFKYVFSIAMLCLGILSGIGLQEAEVQAAQAADLAGAETAIIQAYQNYQTQVDVTAYHLYNVRDDAAVSDLMSKVLNQTPGLFYTGSQYSKYVVVGTGQIKSLQLEYADSFHNADGTINTSKIQTTQKKINRKINQALQCVKPGMSKVEKALVLHDYLIKNTQYNDDSSKEYRYSEWGVLVKRKGNCQGYSLAYAILMQKVGIPVQYVTSEQMMHMWNQIKIGGKWYHVDVTWDDPIDTKQQQDQYGLVLHDRFLCSASKMKKLGYYAFTAKAAKSTKYDHQFWSNITSEIVYRKGKWLYQTGKAIVQRSALTKGKAKKLYRAGGSYFTAFNQDKYYFINYNRIFMYQRKKNKVVFVLNGPENGTISQLKYISGKLTYRVVSGNAVKTVSKKVKKSGLLEKSALS